MKLAARGRDRRDAKIAPDDNHSSVMIHVDVHRVFLDAQAKPNTYVAVSDEDQLERGEVCGCLVKATQRGKRLRRGRKRWRRRCAK